MPSCLITADRDIDRAVACQLYGKIVVGRSDGVRGIMAPEAVTLFVEYRAGNGLYYPCVRIHFEDVQAHTLAVSLETMAKAIRVGHDALPGASQ